MFVVKDKVALIFGAVGGIGKFITKELLDKGVKGLVLADFNDIPVKTFQTELTSLYGENKTVFVKVDVTKVEEVKKCFDIAIETFGALDIVVNSAAIVDESQPNQCISINLIGSINTTMEAYNYLPKFKSSEEEQGVVVNIASLAGLAGLKISAVYSSSKSGLIMFGYCIAHQKELEEDFTVRMVTLCPSWTETPMLNSIKQISTTISENIVREIKRSLAHFPIQQPESVAKCILHIIENGKNGSIWVSKDDEPAKLVDFEKILFFAVKHIQQKGKM